MSTTGRTVETERFDGRGRGIEKVSFSVNRVGDQVYVYIKGAGPPKHYVMPLARWRELEEAAKDGEQT